MRNQSLAINDNPLIQRSRAPVWLWISTTICPRWCETAWDPQCWFYHFSYSAWSLEFAWDRRGVLSSAMRILSVCVTCNSTNPAVVRLHWMSLLHVAVWGDSVNTAVSAVCWLDLWFILMVLTTCMPETSLHCHCQAESYVDLFRATKSSNLFTYLLTCFSLYLVSSFVCTSSLLPTITSAKCQ